jgi:hypothetical protein
MLTKTLLVSAVLFASFASAFAASHPVPKPFSYRVQIPAAALSCDQEAQALGQRFAKATGLSVTGSVCQSTQSIEKQSVYTLVVSYLATAQVTPYSALYTSEGIFKSYVDCLAVLPAQQAAFATNTGLSILSSGCAAASIGDGFSPYIDGIGTPSIHFYSASPSFETSLNDVAGIYDVYRAELAAAGATIVFSSRYDIFYYATARIQVTLNEITAYNTDTNQCQTESLSLQQIYASSGVTAVVNCLAEDFAGRTDLIVSWVGNAFPIKGDDALTSVVYSSFDECEQDKVRVVQNSLSAGTNPTGAICEENQVGNGFVMEVFSTAPYFDFEIK